jgi:adenylate cyclase
MLKYFHKKRYAILTGMVWVIFFSLLSILQQNNTFKEKIDQYLYDYLITLSAHITPPTNIIIIDIDEKSLKAEGRWPWPRSKIAEMLDALSQSNVSVVAMDLIFSEPEANPILTVKKDLQYLSADKIHQLSVTYDYDLMLGQAIKSVDSILGFVLHHEENIQVGLLPKPIENSSCDKLRTVPTLAGYTANLPELQLKSKGAGFVTTIRDPDGVIRRVPMVLCHDNKLYASLSLMAVKQYLLSDKLAVKTEKIGPKEIISSIHLDGIDIPTDEMGEVLVTYLGPEKTFQYISATDIIQHSFKPDILEGAFVFIGTSAFGLSDLQIVPQSRAFPGVEVHASVAASILDQTIRQFPAWHLGAELSILCVVGFLMVLVLPLLSPIQLIVVVIGIIGSLFSFDYYLFLQKNIVLSFSYVYCLMLVLVFHYMFVGYFFERRTKKLIEGLFGQYVPPGQVKKMSEDPSRYGFEGETKELTVLFSDIRNFTHYTEKLEADKVKHFLNAYFTPMTKLIFDSGGTIDKYIGDMIMAFWGAPMEDADHRTHALEAALNMRDFSDLFLKETGDSTLGLGIGLNTGSVHVGDMGSEFRRSYTVLGDAVNLASRLESATKYYQVGIIVSEEVTKGQMGYVFKPLDKVKVKGKDIAVTIYELIGRVSTVSEKAVLEIEQFKLALKHFYAQEWIEAESILVDLCQDCPDCKVYVLYLERVSAFKYKPRNPNWDGVFVLRSK